MIDSLRPKVGHRDGYTSYFYLFDIGVRSSLLSPPVIDRSLIKAGFLKKILNCKFLIVVNTFYVGKPSQIYFRKVSKTEECILSFSLWVN